MTVSAEAGRRAEGPRVRWPKFKLTQPQREEIMAYILISPWIIGFLWFTLGPMLTSLGLSFTETDLFTSEFVGFANYERLLSTDVTLSLFWKSLYNTAYYVFLSIPLTMIVGFVIALLLNQNIRGQSVYRILYYLPSVIPGIASALLWLWLFNPEFGVINWLLSLVGIAGPRWLYDTETAKLALVIMSLWTAGGNMLVFLAGLQGIPTQLYEAATIDGANAWRRFIHITLPMISPTLFFVLITNIIQSFQIFTTVYVVSDGKGGPANSTMMYVLWLYLLAFRQFRMGFASALAWVFFIIIMLFTVLIFRSSSAWVYYETEIGEGRP
jgi:multiple sugar transport system permease protein